MMRWAFGIVLAGALGVLPGAGAQAQTATGEASGVGHSPVIGSGANGNGPVVTGTAPAPGTASPAGTSPAAGTAPAAGTSPAAGTAPAAGTSPAAGTAPQ